MVVTILPPAESQYFNQSTGLPLSFGTISYFVPGTTTAKSTWSDALGTVLNANPVRLDSAGRAIVYGSGQYQMVVSDFNGNQQYSQITASNDWGISLLGLGISPVMIPVVEASTLTQALTNIGISTPWQPVLATQNLQAGLDIITFGAAVHQAPSATGIFFAGNGARINRLNDRVFIGPATFNDGAFPNVTKDWLTAIQQSTGISPVVSSTVAILENGNGEALTVGAQTLPFTSPNSAAIAIEGYGYANSPNVAADCWAYYGESHRTTALPCNAYGMELAVCNRSGSAMLQTPYSGNPGVVIGLQLDSGNSFGIAQEPGLVPASSAITIVQNTSDNSAPFLKGIIFSQNSLQSILGLSEAISFYQGNFIQWYAPNGQQTSTISCIQTSQNQTIHQSFNENGLQFLQHSNANPLVAIQCVVNPVNYILMGGSSSGASGTSPTAGAPFISSAGAVIGGDANPNLLITTQGSGVVISGSHFVPEGNNLFTLGNVTNQWASLWLANGTILPSQESLKTDISRLPSTLDVVNNLHPISFKWKDGGDNQPGKRTHWGFLASDVKEQMNKTGIDFGGYVEENGSEGLRPDQLLPVLWRAVQTISADFEAYKASHP